MSGRTYRVAQWATGNIGTKSLRGIIEHPRLELVGLHVYSDDKVGKDAGELCGVAPTGVLATNTIDDIIDLGADCVLFMPSRNDVDSICRILESGTNVVTTRGEYHRPASLPDETRQRIEAACEKGGVSLHSTGSSPGFSSELLPLALLALQRRLDRIEVNEYADMTSRNSPDLVFTVMGFGKKPDEFDTRRFAHIATHFGPSLSVLADAIGKPIDRIEPGGEIAVATSDIEIAAGVVPAGTVAAQRPMATCFHDGEPFLRFAANWYVTDQLEPAWHVQETGWRLQIHGDTPLDVRISFPVDPEDYPNVSPGFTAHPAVNAVIPVCEAPPGMRTSVELPKIVPVFA